VSMSISAGFGKPYMLGLLPIAASIAVFLWARSRERLRLIAASMGPPRGSWVLREGLAMAKVAAVLLIVLALAQPYVENRVERRIDISDTGLLRSKPVVVVVLLDASKSMGYPMGGETRMEAAKRFLRGFLEGVGANTTVHLVVFAGNTTPLYTGGPEGAAKALDSVEPVYRYTAIGDALAYALGFIRASGLPGAVLLVSDGGQNYGSDPVQAASAYRRGHVPLLVVAVDGPGVLPDVAAAAGGRLYRLDPYTLPALSSVSGEAWREARLEALQARGEAKIVEVERNYSASLVLAVFAAVLVVVSALGGEPW